MLTAMTEEDWTIVLRVFAASRSRRGDVAPSFYPAAIGVWRSTLPSWVVMAAVRGAEPSV